MTIIVGGGPTGLMTALALARRGIESTVLEARDAPTDALQSRAITWMPRGMDVAQAVGALPALEAKALRRLRHVPGQRWARSRRERLPGRAEPSPLHPADPAGGLRTCAGESGR